MRAELYSGIGAVPAQRSEAVVVPRRAYVGQAIVVAPPLPVVPDVHGIGDAVLRHLQKVRPCGAEIAPPLVKAHLARKPLHTRCRRVAGRDGELPRRVECAARRRDERQRGVVARYERMEVPAGIALQDIGENVGRLKERKAVRVVCANVSRRQAEPFGVEPEPDGILHHVSESRVRAHGGKRALADCQAGVAWRSGRRALREGNAPLHLKRPLLRPELRAKYPPESAPVVNLHPAVDVKHRKAVHRLDPRSIDIALEPGEDEPPVGIADADLRVKEPIGPKLDLREKWFFAFVKRPYRGAASGGPGRTGPEQGDRMKHERLRPELCMDGVYPLDYARACNGGAPEHTLLAWLYGHLLAGIAGDRPVVVKPDVQHTPDPALPHVRNRYAQFKRLASVDFAHVRRSVGRAALVEPRNPQRHAVLLVDRREKSEQPERRSGDGCDSKCSLESHEVPPFTARPL